MHAYLGRQIGITGTRGFIADQHAEHLVAQPSAPWMRERCVSHRHPERSEGSRVAADEILRCIEKDKRGLFIARS